MYLTVDQMPKCDNCGILMPAAHRAFEHHGATLAMCSERCERVYESYTFPRYRERILSETVSSGR